MNITAEWENFRWSRNGRTLLDVPRLQLSGPGLVVLLGATGSGKTSLLRSLAHDLEHLPGARVEGHLRIELPAGRGPPPLAYLPQEPSNAFLSFDPETELALREQALGVPRARAQRDALERLARLGLGDRATTPTERLSGGERKRLALAALQVGRPPVLLLDEPFNHLDPAAQEQLGEDVRRAAQDSLILLATHLPSPALEWADELVVLREGQVAHHGTRQSMSSLESTFPEIVPPRLGSPRRSPASEPFIEIEEATLRAGSRVLLRDVSARFGPGLHALRGPNGSGKTTLLRALMGLHPLSGGRLCILGRDIRDQPTHQRSRFLSYHPEEPGLMFFSPTAAEEVTLAPVNHGLPGCDVTARLREAELDFDLDGLLDRNPWSLSGGQRERLALACVDAARTPITLLDEPTHGLDAAGRRLLHAFLSRAAARGVCVLVATHDPDLWHLAHTVHSIQDGQLRPNGSPLLEVVA